MNVYHRCHPCHGFSVFAGVVDAGNKFITGDNDTGDKFIAGDNNVGDQGVWGVFHGSSNDTIGGRVRLRQPCPTLAARDIAVLV